VLKKLTHITCRHAHELLSEQMDHPLPLMARVRLQLHLKACAMCARVEQQMTFMRKAVRRLGQ
jgi:hypothetical protein